MSGINCESLVDKHTYTRAATSSVGTTATEAVAMVAEVMAAEAVAAADPPIALHFSQIPTEAFTIRITGLK